ncbi:MAG: type II secretion system F family protein [Candidatus Diapherotrites archaeon]|nr:type II secretion system F family protein [Candidatus Diapherotrites archaeon]
MLYSIDRANNVNRKFVWIGERLAKVFYNLEYDLAKAGLEISSEKYLTAAFFSALVYGIAIFFFLYGLFFLRDAEITAQNSVLAFAIGFAFFIVFFLIQKIYPGIMAKKYAAGIDQSLIYALKSMLVQVSSGLNLFETMVNISRANYGTVSKEFEDVVQDISSGESEPRALEKLALKTKSEYLKRTSWQIITALRSGASLEGALKSVIQTLTAQQLRAIKNYAAELNMWILVYLLFAAAIPTLGITFLVILSAMSGASIGQEHIILMAVGAFVMQIVLIGFVKTRIPKVFL